MLCLYCHLIVHVFVYDFCFFCFCKTSEHWLKRWQKECWWIDLTTHRHTCRAGNLACCKDLQEDTSADRRLGLLQITKSLSPHQRVRETKQTRKRGENEFYVEMVNLKYQDKFFNCVNQSHYEKKERMYSWPPTVGCLICFNKHCESYGESKVIEL